MHMAMVIGGGVLLLGLFLLVGQRWGSAGTARAARIFIPVWAAMALVNMWVGVTQAGYTVGEELPILLVVFAVPVVLAIIAMRRNAASARP